ncbi:MAG: Hsp20/alpha crystallin family protein [Syntrophales bacterium]|nr:Hsp20/alpha crystallin family protein [Syntrophales bacterium]
MSYIKIRFRNDRSMIEREIKDAFEDMFSMAHPTLFSMGEHTWRPHTDIYETPEEILVIMDLAGIPRDEIHLEVGRKAIKIFGKRDQKAIAGTSRYRLAEIPYGYFERHLGLPAAVDTDHIEATYKDGLLEIRMMKLPPEGNIVKKINITK